MDMPQIKDEIARKLRELGYSTTLFALTRMTFTINQGSSTSCYGSFEISSANVKKLEIKVFSKKDDFLFPPGGPDMGGGYYLYKRFNKSISSVDGILKFIAESLKSNWHLRLMMNPESAPPPPFSFSDDKFYITEREVYHGNMICVEVLDIVSTSGHIVSSTAYNPSQKPWVLLDIRSINCGRMLMITDGDSWYPVQKNIISGQPKHMIFWKLEDTTKMAALNFGIHDKNLINAAIEQHMTASGVHF